MSLGRKCVNCGHTLKITEWGPKRTCPFCGKCTVDVDIKEAHVLFGDCYSHSFEYFIKDEALDSALQRNRNGKDIYMGVDYHCVRLYYELCVGDISNPPYSNANFYAHYSGSYRTALERRERALEKLDSVDNAVPVYIWLSDDEANEYMNLLYFANTFERFENVFLVRWDHTEKDFDGSKVSMIEALKRKSKLSTNELNEFSARFAEIQGLNPECIMGNSEKVEPWFFSKVEGYVLSCMTNRYRTFDSIYLKVSNAIKKDTSFSIYYRMVEETVHRLMMTGKIKSHGACMWWGESIYNNMLCTQSFRIADRQTKGCSFDIAFKAVSNAFEFGYTYPLYDLLDDDSSLVLDVQTVVGKRGIIEYIENDGAYRVHFCKQKVTCDIINVEDGEGYQKDDVYVLLRYEKEGLNDSWLIKVAFYDNIIRSIEISEPKGGLKLKPIKE